MFDVAYYHLPGFRHYYVVKGHAEAYASQPDLDHCSGFVMAPFAADTGTPYLLISPERVKTQPVPRRVTALGTEWLESDNKPLYLDNYHEMHRMLDKGLLDKVVLARRVDGRMTAWKYTPERLFRKACAMYPSQMTVLVVSETAGIWLMSTPEVLLRNDDDRWTTMALAGTVRGMDRWTDKDIREQQIVEQYIEETITPFADDVEKEGPYTTDAATLRHRRTDFSFRLRPGASVSKLVETLHPTPAVCGLPKDIAQGVIRSYESIDRRYYSGFCGPWNIDGERALFVSLRCMETDGSRNFHLYAGGGLLRESDVRKEWTETEQKMNTMRNVLR